MEGVQGKREGSLIENIFEALQSGFYSYKLMADLALLGG